jgi:serine/threonine protein kinase
MPVRYARAASQTLAEAETAHGPVRPAPAPDAEAMPARVGRYEILGLLGEGAMGRVYHAFDPVEGRGVAVKQVRELLLRDLAVMRRFRREVEAVGRLSHPGLVSIHGVGPDYMVLELVEGESLEDRLDREGVLSPAEALPVLRMMAEALDYIHAQGIVHRDVKPSNVLLPPGGALKITDFGIAHLSWAPITGTGELIGSPGYMAPEQITLGGVEPASDIYTLGVVAFQCLTGSRPFSGSSVGQLLIRIVDEDPPVATERNPALPSAVDGVLRRALAKDPHERFASARDLVDALDDALA